MLLFWVAIPFRTFLFLEVGHSLGSPTLREGEQHLRRGSHQVFQAFLLREEELWLRKESLRIKNINAIFTMHKSPNSTDKWIFEKFDDE